MTRPAVTQVRRYNWLDGDDRIEGVAIMSNYQIRVHMTPAEALQVAHDIADTLQEMNTHED